MAQQRQILNKSLQLADTLSDDRGFLLLRALTEHFSIQIVFRPLLVEAMLASVPASAGNPPRWIVLINNERWNFANSALAAETADNPLPPRLRNTIAHEVLHSLSFRIAGTDFEFREKRRPNESDVDFIKRIERETEQLSPLFLIPNKSLQQLAKKDVVYPEDLLRLKKLCGATRDVLVNRFILWRRYDESGSLFGGGLDDIGFGIGEWSGGRAYLKDLPLFSNFRDARLPHLYHLLHSKKTVCIDDVCSDRNFLLLGGSLEWTELDGHREGQFLEYLKMRIRISVEPRAASRKGKFLFFVEKLHENRPSWSDGAGSRRMI